MAGPASSKASSSRSCAAVSLHRTPPAPFEASAARPPASSARRHRFADIRDTRNRLATSPSLAPASIISAAASRTCSRRPRSSASSPPPSGDPDRRERRHAPELEPPHRSARPDHCGRNGTGGRHLAWPGHEVRRVEHRDVLTSRRRGDPPSNVNRAIRQRGTPRPLPSALAGDL
jgi:hypothetical protein